MNNRCVTDEKELDAVPEQYPNRYKPGQSGNPAGRPKKTKEEEALLEQLKQLTPLALQKMKGMLDDLLDAAELIQVRRENEERAALIRTRTAEL